MKFGSKKVHLTSKIKISIIIHATFAFRDTTPSVRERITVLATHLGEKENTTSELVYLAHNVYAFFGIISVI